MGTMYSRIVSSPKQKPIIILNQACCYSCNTIVRFEGQCKCGNVTVFGGSDQLGRTVKDKTTYGDCSLLEYKGL
jgi:hypothetical protein